VSSDEITGASRIPAAFQASLYVLSKFRPQEAWLSLRVSGYRPVASGWPCPRATSSSFAQLPHVLGGPVMSPVVGDIEVLVRPWTGCLKFTVGKYFKSGIDEQCYPV